MLSVCLYFKHLLLILLFSQTMNNLLFCQSPFGFLLQNFKNAKFFMFNLRLKFIALFMLKKKLKIYIYNMFCAAFFTAIIHYELSDKRHLQTCSNPCNITNCYDLLLLLLYWVSLWIKFVLDNLIMKWFLNSEQANYDCLVKHCNS